jgi:hypothetical protein
MDAVLVRDIDPPFLTGLPCSMLCFILSLPPCTLSVDIGDRRKGEALGVDEGVASRSRWLMSEAKSFVAASSRSMNPVIWNR